MLFPIKEIGSSVLPVPRRQGVRTSQVSAPSRTRSRARADEQNSPFVTSATGWRGAGWEALLPDLCSAPVSLLTPLPAAGNSAGAGRSRLGGLDGGARPSPRVVLSRRRVGLPMTASAAPALPR